MPGLKGYLHSYILEVSGTLTNAVWIQKVAQIASSDVLYTAFSEVLTSLSTSYTTLYSNSKTTSLSDTPRLLAKNCQGAFEFPKKHFNLISYIGAFYNPVCVK